jgi:hypothetical protein
MLISLNDPDDVMAGVTKIPFVIRKELLALLRTFYCLKIDHARFTAQPFKVTTFFCITAVSVLTLHAMKTDPSTR